MMATLREIISYVKKNFPATIVNEATGASTTFIQNAILQEMLRQLEERIEKEIRQTVRNQMDKAGQDQLLNAYQDGKIEAYQEVLGEDK